ncbi:hypothetical protein L6R52_26340 [Myxococcota bacterium]|nr:hypothetical protein [Myxococcota bacterium]
MRRSKAWLALGALVVALCAGPRVAVADGKRDLEDGIAFYENLDSERAAERLKAAAEARDLSAPDRARAYLYLGLVHFESGDRPSATAAWQRAFALDRGVKSPAGTSPKAVEAIEAVRAGAKAKPRAEPGGARTSDGTTGAVTRTPTEPGGAAKVEPAPDVTKPVPQKTAPETVPDTPAIDDGAPRAELVEPGPPPASDDDGVPAWLLWGGIGVAVVGAAVVTAVIVGGGGGDCEEAGGCLSVTFQ